MKLLGTGLAVPPLVQIIINSWHDHSRSCSPCACSFKYQSTSSLSTTSSFARSPGSSLPCRLLCVNSLCLNFRERPPGLIQHVLTVLVFWSWVLLLPQLPPSSRSLALFPWASILLHGPLDICLDLLPATFLPPVQSTGCTTHVFTAQGAHADNCETKKNP